MSDERQRRLARERQRRWRRLHHEQNRRRNLAAYHRRKHRFNDLKREKRFRWRRPHPRGWSLEIVTRLELLRPTFLVVHHRGVVKENWETPEELVRRLEKKGALMTAKSDKKPTQPQQLDAETAREILRGSRMDHGQEADKEQTEISIRVQMMLIHTPGEARPEAEAIADRCLKTYWEHVTAMKQLEQICIEDFQREGYVHVLDEKH